MLNRVDITIDRVTEWVSASLPSCCRYKICSNEGTSRLVCCVASCRVSPARKSAFVSFSLAFLAVVAASNSVTVGVASRSAGTFAALISILVGVIACLIATNETYVFAFFRSKPITEPPIESQSHLPGAKANAPGQALLDSYLNQTKVLPTVHPDRVCESSSTSESDSDE